MDHARVLAQRFTGLRVDDCTGGATLGAQLLYDLGVVAVGYEADVLAVRLGGVAQRSHLGQFAHLRLGHAPQGEAQEIELRLGRREKEIGLVAAGILCAKQLGTGGPHGTAHVMTRGEAIGIEFARHLEKIGELRPHIASYAWDRRAPREVIVGELFHHRFAKCALVIKYVVRDTQPIGNGARVGDVISRAARALAASGGTVVVELERDPDHVRAARSGERSDHRTVDPARHGDDDAALGGRARQIEQRGGCVSGGEDRGMGHKRSRCSI